MSVNEAPRVDLEVVARLIKPRARVLDVGSGDGSLLEFLQTDKQVDGHAPGLRGEQAGYVPSYEMARLYLALGDRAEALAWLRRAYDQRSHSLVFLAVDPQLQPLRNDREFRDLLVKTGVGQVPIPAP